MIIFKITIPNKLKIISPGIRQTKANDDQKRTVSIAQAILAGSDYLVVGRPIANAQDPYLTAKQFQNIIKDSISRVTQR